MRPRIVALALALLIGAPLVAPPRAVHADTPAAVSYVALLHAARDALPDDAAALRDLDAAASLAPDPGVLGPVRTSLEMGDDVRARRLLDSTIAVIDLPPNAAGGDAASERQRLDAVYARPPLDSLDRPRPKGLFDELSSLIGRLFDSIFKRLGPGGSTLVGALVLALVLALALLGLRRVSAGRLARAAPEPAGAGVDHDLEWSAALAAAGAGEFREAVRRAFRSALLAVAARGRMAVDPAWTTRELLARTAGDSDLIAALAPAAAAFDVAWYSGRPVGADDWELQRRRCEAIRALAGRRTGASVP